MNAVARLAVLLAATAAAGARAGHAAQRADTAAPLPPEPVIVELRIGRLSQTTVAAYRVRSEVLLPITQFLQLAEIRHRLSPTGTLEATLDPGGRRIVIDARADSMRAGDHRVYLEREFRLFADNELFVGAERLGDLLGLRFAVDWAELTVTVVDAATLPIARRLRRESAREAYLRQPGIARADVTFGLERPAWDGVTVDYAVFAPSAEPLAGATYTAGLGADVGGGSLEIFTQSVGRAADARATLEGSWTGVWREHRWLKQLRLGTVAGTGPHGRPVRGASVTNAPFVRPSLIGALRYAGNLHSGWLVEAYRGGDLVAFDSTAADGSYAIDLPVRYGENPVDFVAYGPFGEIREFNRTYRVLSDLLPARRLEYAFSGGACPAGCEAAANADARYGLSRRATLQFGIDRYWRDSLADRTHPYAVLTANPSNAWALQGEAIAGTLARGALRYEPSVDVRLEGEYTHFTRDSQPVLAVLGRRSQWTVGGFVRPFRDRGFFFFDGRIERMTTDAGAVTRTRFGASLQSATIRLLPYLRTEHDALPRSRAYAGLDAFILPRVFRQVFVRTTTEVERRAGLVAWSAVAARTLGAGRQNLRLELGTQWRRETPGLTWSAALTSSFPAFRAVTSATAPPGRPVSGTQFVQGSVLWDRASGRLDVAPGPALERSGLSGSVFLDENANGRRDLGEPGLAGVRLLVGSLGTVTDSSGGYGLWDLVPFEPVFVSLDSMTLESPLLVPLHARASIVPGPNRYRRLDVPVVQAGVIEGRVLRDGTGRGVGGVTLILTERRSGARRTLVTFTDGAFYLMGVKPGEYELAIPAEVLDVLGLTAAPLRFTLAPGAEGVGRADLELVLRPTR